MSAGRPWKSKIATQAAMVIGILAVLFFLRSPLLWLFARVEAPFAAAGSWTYRTTSGWFARGETLRDRVLRLEEAQARLAMQAADQDRLQGENVQLKALLDLQERTDTPVIASRVIARTHSAGQSRFVINRGEHQGVRRGAAVVVGEGVLVGKVTETTSQTATVSGLADIGALTAVSLLNHTRTIGLASGMTGTLLRVGLIPNDEKVEVNDLVVTSGLEEGIPAGLVIGLVNAVRVQEGGPFQEAVVEPVADVRGFGHVGVLIAPPLDGL